ncbi:MAG TPA: hypothetical protein VF015_04360, partial [Acidimicrobiales bacterium]
MVDPSGSTADVPVVEGAPSVVGVSDVLPDVGGAVVGAEVVGADVVGADVVGAPVVGVPDVGAPVVGGGLVVVDDDG